LIYSIVTEHCVLTG